MQLLWMGRSGRISAEEAMLEQGLNGGRRGGVGIFTGICLRSQAEENARAKALRRLWALGVSTKEASVAGAESGRGEWMRSQKVRL